MGRLNPPFGSAEQIALAMIPKIMSLPSLIGSIVLVRHIVRNPKRRNRLYHRIVAVMSSHNVAFAGVSFMSTWSVPRDTPGVFGAVGTTHTCTAAGFMAQAYPVLCCMPRWWHTLC